MKLAKIFSDGVVLQRNKVIKIFGVGSGTAKITFCNITKCVTTNFDEWLIEFPAMSEGGPYEIVADLNGEIVKVYDVWIGEVWLASGQSNMSFMFWELYKRGEIMPALKEIPNLKYFQVCVDNKLNFDEKNSSWHDCTLSNIARWFSAIPYYFALNLAENTSMHIGIINASRGATRLEWWTPLNSIIGTEFDLPDDIKHKDNIIYSLPKGSLFEGYIKPIVPYVVDGVIWYQGESNRGTKETMFYADIFCNMVKSWREAFGSNLPFITVQLTNFGENMENISDYDKLNPKETAFYTNWARIREQQLKAVTMIADIYLVTSSDTGEFFEIHPADKKSIGDRLALAARNIVFNENNEYTGPLLEGKNIENDKIIVSFSHAEKLFDKEPLCNLCICGEDGVYYPAKYNIVGNKLEVYSTKVKNPINVKYGFVNWSPIKLYNESGFPASPFRTETL